MRLDPGHVFTLFASFLRQGIRNRYGEVSGPAGIYVVSGRESVIISSCP